MSPTALCIVMENVGGARFGDAAALVLSWERLFLDRLESFEIGVREKDRLLLALGRLQVGQELSTQEAELAFWAQAYGAGVVSLAELSTFDRANFLTRVARCELHVEGPAARLRASVGQLAERLQAPADWYDRRLEVRLPVSQTSSVRYDEARKELFVPCDVLPRVGAYLPLALTNPSLSQPIRLSAFVTRVEARSSTSGQRGYAVDLSSLSRSDAAFLRANAAVSAQALRSSPLPALTLPIEYATNGRLLEEYEKQLSKRALFVPPGTVPERLNGPILLLLTLPDRQLLRIPASVVFQSGAGTGLEVHPSTDDWTVLRAAVARARASQLPAPSPPRAPPVPVNDEGVDFGSLSLVSSADPSSSLGGKVQELFVPPVTLEASDRVGNYELLSRLGRGGMAEVFMARAVEGRLKGQTVAIKRILPERAGETRLVNLFASEADLSLRLDHPNIVKSYEVSAHRGEYFLVMELVDGRDVGQIIRRCRRLRIQLPVDFAIFLVKTLLDALDYAHSVQHSPGRKLGVVHRDVSPSNVFLSRLGDVKLGDFGVAGATDFDVVDGLVGKPHYLSPEALGGDQSPARDVWAAAVMLYELLTLQRPFEGATREAVIDSVRAGPFAKVTEVRGDVPPAVGAIVERALSPRREDRFATARELSKALEPCFDPIVGTPLAIAALVRGLFGSVSGNG